MRNSGSLLLALFVLTSCQEGGVAPRVSVPDPQEEVAEEGADRPAEASEPPQDDFQPVVQRLDEAPAFEPGHLIVQLTPELTDRLNQDAAKGLAWDQWAWPQELRELYRSLGVTSVSPVLPLGSASVERLEALRQSYFKRTGRADLRSPLPRLDAFFLVELPVDEDLTAAEEALGADPAVVTTERDVYARVTADTFDNATQQWGLYTINAPAAWGTSTGAGVNVAVIDTGVDLVHPDLAGSLLPGANFVPYVTSAQDDNGHGSHVAGVIAGVTNNLQGIASVAPNAQIIPVKALNMFGSGLIAWLQNAYVWAMSTGYTDVINNSWGGGGTSPMFETSIRTAHLMGIITINAAGNAASPTYGFFPSNVEYGLSVAATDSADVPASYSNTGVKLDVAAPGGASSTSFATGILSTVPPSFSGSGILVDGTGKYAPLAGTSMAAPHVSGLAALLMAANPSWTVEQLRQAIRKGATDVAASGFDVNSGHGRINATASLALPQPPSAQVVLPRNNQVVYGSPMAKGFALPSPSNTANWTLTGGVGSAPSSWIPVASGAATVTDANLAPVNTTLFPDGEVTLRLITTNTSGGMTAEDRNLVQVDNVAISSPANGAHLTGPLYQVWGRAQTQGLVTWSLQWAPGYNATTGFTVLGSGSSPVAANSFMANWSLAPVPEGEVTLRLTATANTAFGPNTTTHQINVIVDKRVLPGFPVRIKDPMGFKTPKLVDLELDGQKEIVIGDSVYLSTGALKAGWNWNPGLGRTVPAVANIDGVSDQETINVLFRSYFYDSTLSGGGAPVVTASKPNHSTLWSFPVLNSVGTIHNGTPSSVSVGNVTGDGRLEAVFAMHFAYSNPTNETTVFVLDAATGTQLYRYNVQGFTWSAIALANLDSDGYQELVMETYDPAITMGRVYALNADGTPLPGWPQLSAVTQGFAEMAPVIGDVDRDCRYEILVGTNLYRNNGTLQPGWPVSLIGRSTGAIANLDGDSQLELAMGGGNAVTSWYVEHTGALNLATLKTHENLYVMGFNENYKQGHPLLADVDGDGKVDLVRQAELGSTDPLRGIPIYAYDLLTSAQKPQTRRVRTTEPNGNYSFPMYSTGALGDLNGDGQLDLVVVARNLVWAWNLGVPYVPAKAPWPMYQRDLRNTGTVPLGFPCPIVVNPGGGEINK